MKRFVGMVIGAALFLAVLGTAYHHFIGPSQVSACGWGRSGGGDYVPQRRGSTDSMAQGPSMSKEQAYDIVAYHLSRLNPNLKVGTINDAGGFYEVDILSSDDELIQRMQEHQIVLKVQKEEIDKLTRDGFDPVYGARPLRREVERQVENPLAMKIVKGECPPGSTVRIGVENKEITFSVGVNIS